MSIYIIHYIFIYTYTNIQEIPHDVSAEEKFLIEYSEGSLFVLGRSGTGDSTIHIYIYMYVYMNVHIRVYTEMCMLIHVYIYMHIYIHAHTFLCKYLITNREDYCDATENAYIYTYIYIYICIYIYIYIYTYT
jgi:hypothetical protein